jgi:predicted permease
MQTLLSDLRYAVRTFWKTPGFAAAAALTLALGIGVNVAVFSLLHAALIETLPVRDPQRVVQVFTWTSEGDHFDFSYPLYVDVRDKAASLEGLAAYLTNTVGFTVADRSERLVGEFVTSNYFPVLGVQVQIGPGLTGADELRGGPKVIVISHALWQNTFAGDVAVVGRTVLINGQTFTVVGVAPRGFTGIVRGQRADLWLSVAQFFPLRNRPDLLDVRDSSWLNLLGRLAPGVTEAQAQQQLTAVVRQVSRTADVTSDYAARVRQAAAGDLGLVESLEAPLQLLMATVGLILLIACANVANLLLARASSRQQEIAVRQALGATRGRIVGHVMAETLVLAAAGGLLGLLFAVWVVDLFEVRPLGGATPLALGTGLNDRVLLFALGLSAIATLVAGLIPALGASRADLVNIIKRGAGSIGVAPGRRRMRSGLAIVQIALSLVMIVGAGLFLRSLWKLRSIEPALATDKVIAATVNLTLRGYDQPRGFQFYEQLWTRVGQIPGVEAATLTSVLPVTGGGSRINLNARATTPQIDVPFEADVINAAPGYFRTFGIPLVRGRDFTLSDRTPGPQVIIINETMKQRLWGNADPVGQILALGPAAVDRYEVVGVARDTKYRNLREAPKMTMYQPLAQSYEPAVNLAVRTSTMREDAVQGLRRELTAIDPALPLYNIRTLAQHVERSLYVDALRARLIASLALLAVALAAVGIYGLISFVVTERTKEVGLRLALGAQPWGILRLVLGAGSRLALAGIGLGVVLSAWLARTAAAQLYVANDLYGVKPTDLVALAGGVLFLYAIVLVAALIPSFRVLRVDPMTALRES